MHVPNLDKSLLVNAFAASSAFATKPRTVSQISGIRLNHWRITFWSKCFASLGRPVNTRTKRLASSLAKPSSRGRRSGTTCNGSRAADLVILAPPMSAPTWSCQPPPVVNICSTFCTAWINDTSSISKPNAIKIAFITTPANMDELPNPEPCGKVLQLATCNPPPASRNCSSNGGAPAAMETIPQHSTQHFNNAAAAPGELWSSRSARERQTMDAEPSAPKSAAPCGPSFHVSNTNVVTSGSRLAFAPMGRLPSTNNAKFTTQPPCS
mmetsp:Transcript_125939/g.403212  ORF Transcript_125939/g.403212 Transcript_125939/m.403212 type:complete len:267 (+) Transcript_125939:411-1211(+)